MKSLQELSAKGVARAVERLYETQLCEGHLDLIMKEIEPFPIFISHPVILTTCPVCGEHKNNGGWFSVFCDCQDPNWEYKRCVRRKEGMSWAEASKKLVPLVIDRPDIHKKTNYKAYYNPELQKIYIHSKNDYLHGRNTELSYCHEAIYFSPETSLKSIAYNSHGESFVFDDENISIDEGYEGYGMRKIKVKYDFFGTYIHPCRCGHILEDIGRKNMSCKECKLGTDQYKKWKVAGKCSGFVKLTEATDTRNNGLFEVLSQGANHLTIRRCN